MRSQCERNANASKTNANASNLDANAMRNGYERNAPNTQYPIPNTKKKNAGNVFRVRHSPVFTMPMDWNPDPDELQNTSTGKSTPKPLTLEQSHGASSGYREATHAKGERRTESGGAGRWSYGRSGACSIRNLTKT